MIRNGSAPTHRVVTRRPADADVAGSEATDGGGPDAVGRIGVENRAVGVAMDYGSAVHLSLAASTVERTVPEEHRAAFERVGDERRRLTDGTEYRVSLPDGREAVTALLSFDPTDTDQWTSRLFDVEEFAVVTAGSWLYRSVPHHGHVREVNAAGEPGLLTALREELGELPETGVFPAGPLVAWEAGGCLYELHPTMFRWRSGEGSWTAPGLERLREVYPQHERVEVLLHWDSPDTVLGRLRGRAADRLGRSPPERVEVPDTEHLDAVAEAFEHVADQLGYDYTVRAENQSDRWER